jgi:hypothetical protein
MEETMSQVTELLDGLAEEETELAELLELAIAYGESGDETVEKLLVRRLEKVIALSGSCGCCEVTPVSEDVDVGDWDDADDEPGFLDEEEDDFYSDEDEEPEEDPEPEIDELSEKLGIDVDSASPIALASNILRLCPNELDQAPVLAELGARGRNIAQLKALLEDL